MAEPLNPIVKEWLLEYVNDWQPGNCKWADDDMQEAFEAGCERCVGILKTLRDEMKQRFIQEDLAAHTLVPLAAAVATTCDIAIARIEKGT